MKKIFYIFTVICALASCSERDSFVEVLPEIKAKGDAIHIAGVETCGLEVSASNAGTRSTRAGLLKDAETVSWLVNPLIEGLDISFGKFGDESSRRVAILKLLNEKGSTTGYDKDENSGLALYSFKYKGTQDDAIWVDNGSHFFEGVYVPDYLRYGTAYTENRQSITSVNSQMIPNMLTDQSNDTETGAYTLLTHYLAMPPNTRIKATVGRVKLPFRHRLARIKAYVLIDPEMGENVTLKGFELVNGKDNPSTTSLRFCNVDVLEGVEDTKNTNDTHILTPHWTKPKKITPHFLEMSGSKDGYDNVLDENFIMFYDDKTMSYVFPTDEKWAGYKGKTDSQLAEGKITKTVYGNDNNGHKVPVYDLIVRPTYTSVDSVLYDEGNTPTHETLGTTYMNSVEFELTLSNGLVYNKKIDFDLDANYQTVIYLRIGRESVDYNASGSVLWIDALNYDSWYGIDNTGEHSLSIAGSSWQRAFTYGWNITNKPNEDKVDKVTDGGFYNEITTPEDGVKGQYLTKETWISAFAQAYNDGEHHGDYFILTDDIDIDARLLPDNFVFTGHLDAQGHKITLTNVGTAWTEYKETDEYSLYETETLFSASDGSVKYSMPELYKKVEHEAEYYQEEDLVTVNDKYYVKETLDYHPEVKDEEGNVVTPAYYEIVDASVEATAGVTIKTAGWTEYIIYDTQPTLVDVVNNLTEYFKKVEEDNYQRYSLEGIVFYKAVSHKSGSALFAGLNGNYAASKGEANVHLQGGELVPYIDVETGTGWRAEVINLNVKGKLFKANAVITGNVQNCYEIGDNNERTKVTNHTPALPKYK